MAPWRCGLFVWLAALPLAAATIDVSLQPSLLLCPGDALEFTFSSAGYRAYAGSAPDRLAFTLASLPFASEASFSATLESSDHGLSAAFGSVAVAPGYYQGSLYLGAVSAISGSLAISPDMAAVFSGPALLVLRNTGAEVTLGLPPYGLSHDLSISLSGKGVSVGGKVLGVTYEPALQDSPLSDMQFSSLEDQLGPLGGPEPVPEPRPLALLTAGGALLLLLKRKPKPMPRAGIE